MTDVMPFILFTCLFTRFGLSSGFDRVVEDVVLDIETLPSYTDEVDTMETDEI